MFIIIFLLVMIVVLLGGGPIFGSLISIVIIVLLVTVGGTWMTVEGYWPQFFLVIIVIFAIGGLIYSKTREDEKKRKAKMRKEYLARPKEEREHVVYNLKAWRMHNRETKLRVLGKLLKKNNASERLKKLGWEPIKLQQEILSAEQGRGSYIRRLVAHDLEAAMLEFLDYLEASVELELKKEWVVENPKNLNVEVESGQSQSKPLIADELEKLSKLHKQGILTKEEFNDQKAKLLSVT